jgi:hypothetical protein
MVRSHVCALLDEDSKADDIQLGQPSYGGLKSGAIRMPKLPVDPSKAAAWSRLLLVETIARLLKNQLRACFRQILETQHVVGQETFCQAAVALVNQRLGRNPGADHFWYTRLSLTCFLN